MNLKHLTPVIAVLGLLASPAVALDARQFVQMLKDNGEQLKSYSWKSRTNVTVDSEPKSTKLYQVRHDYEGKLEKIEIDGEPAKKIRGPVRKRVAKKKMKQAAELKQSLQALIESYTRLDPQKIQELNAAGDIFIGVGADPGTQRVMIRNVQRQGDTMEIYVDDVSKRMRQYKIVSSLEGEPVNVKVDFADLINGPTYPARVTVQTEQKDKPMVIEIENFDYIRQGS